LAVRWRSAALKVEMIAREVPTNAMMTPDTIT
jgi:hypothetical protein